MAGSAESENKEPQAKSPWNSLEITKVIAAATVPLAIFSLGYCANERAREEAQLSRLLEGRLRAWEAAGPDVRQIRNRSADLLAYFGQQTGNPQAAAASPLNDPAIRKKTVDEEIVNRALQVDGRLEVNPFFTPQLFQYYLDFSHCAIELAQGVQMNVENVQPPYSSKELGELWRRLDGRYKVLVERVRSELAGKEEPSGDQNTSYPERVSRAGGKENSLCRP